MGEVGYALNPMSDQIPRSPSQHHFRMAASDVCWSPEAKADHASPTIWATGLKRGCKAVTLVEAMISLLILGMFMLTFIGAFMHSRKVTEANVLHAAASSLVYGIIEQMKGMDYATLLPNGAIDPAQIPAVPVGTVAPYYTVRIRINPTLTVWLRPVYTPATVDGATGSAPSLPIAAHAPTPAGAIDNFVGSLPLSTVTGTRGQDLALNIWLWIDEIPSRTNDVTEAKKVTLVYTYSYNDGSSVHTVRDGEVFIRTRFDQ